MFAMPAAHPTLPIPSYARVTNPANGRTVLLRINDRGPFHAGRIIDLSYAAAFKLDLLRGVAPVLLERITFGEIRSGAWQRTIGPAVPSEPAAAPLTGAGAELRVAIDDAEPGAGTRHCASSPDRHRCPRVGPLARTGILDPARRLSPDRRRVVLPPPRGGRVGLARALVGCFPQRTAGPTAGRPLREPRQGAARRGADS